MLALAVSASNIRVASDAPVPKIVASEGATVIIPEANFLLNAEFVRQGADLLLSGADGRETSPPREFAAQYRSAER